MPQRQLRKKIAFAILDSYDHCRVGSLENVGFPFLHVRFDYCRENRKTIQPA